MKLRLDTLAFASCMLTACNGCGTRGGDEEVPDGYPPDIQFFDVVRDIDAADATDAQIANDAETGWYTYPFMPAACDLHHAVNASAFIPPLHWVPCSFGAAGCTQLVVDWSTTPPDTQAVLGVGGWSDGVHDWFAVLEKLTSGQRRLVLAAGDGTPIDAWIMPFAITDSFCGAGGLTFAAGTFSFVTTALGDPPYIWSLVRGDLAPDPNERLIRNVTTADQRGASYPPQYVAMTSQIFATTLGEIGWLERITPTSFASLAPYERAAPGSPDGGLFDGIVSGNFGVVGTDIIYASSYYTRDDGSTGWVILVQPISGPPYVLLDQPGRDALGVFTDGTDLVWVVGVEPYDGTNWAGYELWTAPYTTDPAALAPRLVAPLDTGVASTGLGDSVFGFGRFAYLRCPGSFCGLATRVINVADGSYWDITPPPGPGVPGWGGLSYIGPDEVGMGFIVGAVLTTFVRQRISALGAPTPADAGVDGGG